MNKPRLLILIVAYDAESTISSVLRRIPPLSEVEAEVLILDDASGDSTFEIAERSISNQRPGIPVKVLRNPNNQGYGGNQKIGYHYAIANGFDFVALIHGDGQYAPEELPRLLTPLLNGEADVVLGSRMMRGKDALRGGMPLYKFVGNRILTTMQNLLLGSRLSEFHTGYRLYATAALQRIPYRLNADGFHFDTEILIQLMAADQRIIELPIATHYGDEVCHVDGVAYAWQVMLATIKARLQRYGIFFDRKYDVATPAARYEAKLDFPSPHVFAVDEVPAGSVVVDIGCSDGHIAQALSAKGCRVIGIDREEPAQNAGFHRFLRHDLDQGLPTDIGEDISWILLLDVIEHLRAPEAFADDLHRLLARNPDARVIVSTGNVGFIVVRLMLLLGQFNYGRRGILDMTHTRLFTFASLRRLLEGACFHVERVAAIPAPFPLALGRNRFGFALLHINQLLIRLWRSLFAYQMVFVCRPIVSLEWLLAEAETAAARRRAAMAETERAH